VQQLQSKQAALLEPTSKKRSLQEDTTTTNHEESIERSTRLRTSPPASTLLPSDFKSTPITTATTTFSTTTGSNRVQPQLVPQVNQQPTPKKDQEESEDLTDLPEIVDEGPDSSDND
jgi:hypothetical protein